MKKNAIIVAGGKGLRMGVDIPKQFIPVGGKPILMRTIGAFYDFDPSIRIVLALGKDYIEYWSELCDEYQFLIPHEIVKGGDTRFHSVKNALDVIDEGCVAVHDAVRPFLSNELLNNCFQLVQIYRAVVPAIDVIDSLRLLKGSKSKIVDRNLYKLVQTPQVFDCSVLKSAYNLDYSILFTDDASVVEALGFDVYLIDGDRQNIKITTPFDLKFAEFMVDKI